jgi:hypothetical protein
MSAMAARGMPKFEAGPQKSVVVIIVSHDTRAYGELIDRAAQLLRSTRETNQPAQSTAVVLPSLMRGLCMS